MEARFVVRVLDDAQALLGWAEVLASARPQPRGASCPLWPAAPTLTFLMERAGRARYIAIHWADLDIARLKTIDPIDVVVGQIVTLSWDEPMWLVAGMRDVPLPAVTVHSPSSSGCRPALGCGTRCCVSRRASRSMAIQSKGILARLGSGVSSLSFPLTTTTTTIEVDEIGVLVFSSDNTSLTDGDNGEVASVTDPREHLDEVGEFTHSPTGVAGDGVTVAVDHAATAQLLVGSPSPSRSRRARRQGCVGYVFTFAPGGTLAVSTAPIATTAVNSFGFGPATFSGLALLNRLWFRAGAKEVNSTSLLGPTPNFTWIGGGRSQNATQAVIVRGEFYINTSTGETSDPTGAGSGDSAALFFPFKEVVLSP